MSARRPERPEGELSDPRQCIALACGVSAAGSYFLCAESSLRALGGAGARARTALSRAPKQGKRASDPGSQTGHESTQFPVEATAPPVAIGG